MLRLFCSDIFAKIIYPRAREHQQQKLNDIFFREIFFFTSLLLVVVQLALSIQLDILYIYFFAASLE